MFSKKFYYQNLNKFEIRTRDVRHAAREKRGKLFGKLASSHRLSPRPILRLFCSHSALTPSHANSRLTTRGRGFLNLSLFV